MCTVGIKQEQDRCIMGMKGVEDACIACLFARFGHTRRLPTVNRKIAQQRIALPAFHRAHYARVSLFSCMPTILVDPIQSVTRRNSY
jgi:hypothetical protein